MKVMGIKDIDKFFEVVDSCKGRVELVTGEGDRLNLKSKLAQYVSLANIFSNGEIPEGAAAQADQAIGNLAALLKEAGTSTENVVKTTVFIKNMEDFGTINEVYAKYFTGTYPARSCVEVARLPKDVLIEIEAIAIK